MPLPARSPTLLACALALCLGLSAPAPLAAAPGASRPAVVAVAAAPLAEQWSWSEFVKYWRHQTTGRTSGIVCIALLVAAAAMLIILSKSKL